MKSKLVILALLGVCLWGREVHADTVVDISATWCAACNGTGMPVDLQAQVTVEPATGTFFNSGTNSFFTGNVLEVTGISGTLNGSPISFLQAPQGDGSWIYPDLFVGTVYFLANGLPCWIQNDVQFNLIEINTDAGFTLTIPINYSATVNTPEAGTLGLFGLGFLFLCCRLKARGRIAGLRQID